MSVQLIAHALVKHEGRYLVIKRSMIKRGKPNAYVGYYDIPGGDYVIIMIGAINAVKSRI